MAIIIPKLKLPTIRRKAKKSRVFRMFKILDDGSFLIAGKVDRYREYNRRSSR